MPGSHRFLPLSPRFLTLLLAFFLALPLHVNAQVYGRYDLKQVVDITETQQGKNHKLDMAYLDTILNDLARHARNAPPRFASAQDAERAVRDAGILVKVFDILMNTAGNEPDLVLRAAFLNSIAHNLGVEGAGQRAEQLYQKLLALTPDNARAHYEYGTFLAGTGKLEAALPHLKIAQARGNEKAGYSIGLVQLSLGNREKALQALEDYQRKAPADKDVGRLIAAIRNQTLTPGLMPGAPTLPAAKAP